MPSMEKLYEGKAKILYSTDDPEVLIAHFKDDATAFNAQKRGSIRNKGEINCQIAAALFELLEGAGIPTHFRARTDPMRMEVTAATIVPIEVVVRNIAAGSLCRETGLPEGQVLPAPLVEYYYKDDSLGDPLLTRDRLMLLGLVDEGQLARIRELALAINQVLRDFFHRCQITLVDFKVEFGRDRQGNLLLADEISPDTCRLWDDTVTDASERVLDKDRFRRDLGKVEEAYQQVLARILARLDVERA